MCAGENQADQSEESLVGSTEKWMEKCHFTLIFLSVKISHLLSLQSVHITAGFQAPFGAGEGTDVQFSAAGSRGRGAGGED